MITNTNVSKLLNRLLGTKAEVFKIGIDQHARDVVLCVQVDGSLPQRPQKMSAAEGVRLVRGLVQDGRKVVCCYESGPCGYGLYRAMVKAGAECLVIAPRATVDGRRQKTDGIDAGKLVDGLDRYLRGNQKAFTVVTVPSEEEEDGRQQGRLREQLKTSRHQWEARGRSLLLFKGYHVSGPWWRQKRWEELKPTLSALLVSELEMMRTILVQLDNLERQRRKQLEAAAPKSLPKAIGALTWVLLLREVRRWDRFKNRGQVSSYTGLCPGGYQSGATKRDGSINRYGNPRVRALLIELVWRLTRWQPDYPPVRQLVMRTVSGGARRKLAVAAARRLAVDLWRLATGQTTAAKLHLIVPVLPS